MYSHGCATFDLPIHVARNIKGALAHPQVRPSPPHAIVCVFLSASVVFLSPIICLKVLIQIIELSLKFRTQDIIGKVVVEDLLAKYYLVARSQNCLYSGHSPQKPRNQGRRKGFSNASSEIHFLDFMLFYMTDIFNRYFALYKLFPRVFLQVVYVLRY